MIESTSFGHVVQVSRKEHTPRWCRCAWHVDLSCFRHQETRRSGSRRHEVEHYATCVWTSGCGNRFCLHSGCGEAWRLDIACQSRGVRLSIEMTSNVLPCGFWYCKADQIVTWSGRAVSTRACQLPPFRADVLQRLHSAVVGSAWAVTRRFHAMRNA